MDRERLAVRQGMVTVAACLAFLFVLTLGAQLPGPLRSYQGSAEQVWPQRWNFFTKSPFEPELVAYQQGHSVLLTPQGRLANAFGLSRRQRAQRPELEVLADGVDAGTWRNCGAALFAGCERLVGEVPRQTLSNRSPLPSLCGDLVIAEERQQPAGWRIVRVAAVTVLCQP